MLGNKTSLTTFKKTVISTKHLFEYNDVKLEKNSRRKIGGKNKYVEIKQHTANNPLVKEEIK